MSAFPYEVPEDLMAAIENAGRVLLATHENPDPDGLGSLVALGLALAERGRHVARVSTGPLPEALADLPGVDRIEVADPDERFDLGLLFDAHRRGRLGGAAPRLDAADRVLAIDHHPPGPEGSDCDDAWIVPDAPATAMLVLSVLRRMHDVPLGTEKASCLYAGLLTDTGGFQHANTTHDALLAAADLVSLGADPAAIADRLMSRRRPQAVRLRGEALATTDYRLGGALALMVVERELLERTGADLDDTEGLVSELTGVEGVRVAALLKQGENGDWRVSLRSGDGTYVDGIARRFGGGGHHRAAAFSTEAVGRDDVERELLEAVAAALDEAGDTR